MSRMENRLKFLRVMDDPRQAARVIPKKRLEIAIGIHTLDIRKLYTATGASIAG
jgi:hypothetical protein